MTRKVRDSGLEGRSARLKLAVRRRPYRGPALGRGIALLYRRNHHNGSWVVKCADGHGGYWTKVIGQADDFDTSDGTKVLDFWQAQDAAKRLARGGADIGTAPVTVDGALIDYKRDLISRGANSSNAVRPRKHLSPVLLAKPVQLLTSKELKTWRDGLLGKLAPASVNRLCNCICAALELARINVTATPPAAGTSKWENTQDDLANLVGAIADANIDASDAVFIANARDAVFDQGTRWRSGQ